ncbi:MAG: YgeY family selenium metabolism-linked hydrolase [Candidatus Wallbacteria bacterium]|nr:YgeY family selenium metabolism-linked hydrolase [Candidatus Wallbacteria bacterium]
MDYQTILNKAKEYEAETAEILARLVQTPSFSGKEKEVADLICDEMRKNGFDSVRIDGLGSVIGTIGNGPRTMAFDAHIDTVYPGERGNWKFDPFAGKIEDGFVLGRGASDQKAGMASMITAGRMIKELKLNDKFTVLFTGTVMEEDCDGLCWHYLISEEKVRPELVVSTEPTSLNIYRGHRGRMEMTIEVKGVSCHGSAPERGDNAIYKMARIALEIERLNERLKTDSFLGKGTICASVFESGSPSQCAVADFARIQVDRRLTNGENRESAVAELQDCAVRAGCPGAVVKVLHYDATAYTGMKFGMDKYFPTWVLDEKSTWISDAESAYHSLFGKDPLIDKWTFSTNGIATAGMHGIPTMGFGPGDEVQAHAPNERARISDLSAAAAFYAGLVHKLNG